MNTKFQLLKRATRFALVLLLLSAAGMTKAFAQKSWTNVRVSASPPNGGTVSGGGYYYYGELVTISASANQGYTFKYWKCNKCGHIVTYQASYSFIWGDGHHHYQGLFGSDNGYYSFTAYFSHIYNITVSANPGNGGTVTGGGTYNEGDSCTLIASPNMGYHFVKWTKNGSQVSTNPTYSFTVTENASYVAHFSPNSCSISATANPAEGGTVTGAGIYNAGETCTLIAAPNQGYIFNDWTENGTCVSFNPSYSFTVGGNRTLVANFVEAGSGILNGLFSVNDSTQVNFSQGNLQYQAYTNTWRFALNQYEYVGTDNTNISATYDGWIDLFGWGTSGYNHGAVCYQPWSTSSDPSDYFAYGDSNCTLYDQTGRADWGYNAISNGGNQTGQWRTLTRPEWYYLFCTRATSSGMRFAKACVNNVNGVILLPDNWDLSYYGLSSMNSVSASYGSNTITAAQWSTLEEHGAVFLPSAGIRQNLTSISQLDARGYYWASNVVSNTNANACCFTPAVDTIWFQNSWRRYYGMSVRLVCSVQDGSYTINVTANPAEGGTVTGAGSYSFGDTCTLVATPNAGYFFNNWTKNGAVVSTNASYSFTVFGDRTLVANFVQEGSGILNGVFSVNDSTQVNFSQGNLQYQASTNIWRFAINQYECIGSDNINISATYDGWIDLFGWGTSGYNHGAVCYQPWSTSIQANDYYAYGIDSYNLFDQTGQADWGYNAISNGGNQTGQWRTLTCEEWYYLFCTRATSSGIRFAKACVNNVNGVILLPDNWVVSYFALNNPNQSNESYGSNTITAAQWSTLEEYGAVFLPAAGIRKDLTSISHFDARGYYWASTVASNNNVNAYCFTPAVDTIWFQNSWRRYYGMSVRLVCSVQDGSYTINATANPAEGGTVSGVGNYNEGSTCTLTAMANEGYTFMNWTKDGEVVSTLAVYNFTVTEGGNYVANFGLNTYDVTAMANPEQGGTVQGSDVYNYGTTATLIATANTDYVFVSWTENGTTVSAENYYSFIVTGNRTLVANFEMALDNHYEYDPFLYPGNMTVTGIIQIEGVEQRSAALEVGAFCNGECRGAVRPTFMPNVDRYFVFLTIYGNNGDEISFRLYDHATGEESDKLCESTLTFEVNAIVGNALNPFIFNFVDVNTIQATNFNNGWNWWSSYIEFDGSSLQNLENGLGTNGEMIKSQNYGYASYLEGFGWYGSLMAINNQFTYQVKTNAACVVELMGNATNPANHPITLNSGWTWVGYPVNTSISIAEALSGIVPQDNDMLKSQNNGYASYLEGFGWYGSLNTLQPGMGLMYKSNNDSSVTLVYPNSGTRTDLKANQTTGNNHWRPNQNAYPDNMSVMAVVELDGKELQGEQYELAVFANGEVRGSARLLYVEPLNRYIAFLTVAGSEAVELHFGLYNTETGVEETQCIESLQYETNAVIGSFAEPYVVSFRGTTGMDEWVRSLQVFPNPVERGRSINLGLKEETGIVLVEIINALGVVVESVQTQSEQTITVPNVSGIYTLRINVEGKGTCYRRLVVR